MSDTPATPSEIDDKDARYWLSEINAAKDRQETWYDAAEKAAKCYADKTERVFGKLNILWSNVDVQKAALGEEFGQPQVNRLNAPSHQSLSRHVARVWEQTIDAAVKDTNDNADIKLAVQDILLPGRGQVWLELNPISDAEGGVTWVEAPLVKIDYKDYLEGPSNRWASVPWVGRADLYSLDDLKRLLPKDRQGEAGLIPRNYSLPVPKGNDKDRDSASDGAEQFKRAKVWEIWSKHPSKRRIYVAEGYDKSLKVDDDPYRLKNFFPCPKPILASYDENWQRPLTDYSRYQDQIEEINRISGRLFVFIDVLRRRGVYDKSCKELADLALAGDNVLIAVENFQNLMKEGGLNQAIQWEDLTPIIEIVTQLYAQRKELMLLTYEITGLSDLARGQTDADETLGAQKLKQTFGSGRFKAREKESRRFAADAYALKGELIAEHFPREQIEEMSGIAIPTAADRAKAQQTLQRMQAAQQQAQQAGHQVPPVDPYDMEELQAVANAACTWEKLSSVLRSDRRRCYLVEVETDQTAFRDEDADRTARIELLSVINQLVTQWMPILQANPASGEFVKKSIMFVVSSFKSGRSIEEGLEQSIDGMIKQAMQAQQQPPQQDPKAAADAQIAQSRVQAAQVGLQTAQVRLQTEQAKAQNAGVDLNVKAQETQLEAQKGEQKAFQGQQQIAITHEKNQATREGHQIDLINKAEKLEFDRATRATAEEALLHGETRSPKNGAN